MAKRARKGAKKRVYRTTECFKRGEKPRATRKAENMRKNGYTATVVKTKGGWCIKSAGKRLR